MQFQVPQFIEIEDKIIGSLTLKQFGYLTAAVLLSFLFFFIFELFLWLIITTVIGSFAFSLAFLRFNGRPFLITFVSAVQYAWQPKFYVWKRELTKETLPSLPDIKKIRKAEELKRPLENLWDKLNTTTQPISAREKNFLGIFGKDKEAVQKFEVQKKATGERRIYKRIDYR